MFFLVSFFRFLERFSAAHLTVLSFAIVPFLAGVLVFFTEYRRTVNVITPKVGASGVELVKSTQQGESLVDTVFTEVSAACVTGLTSTDFSQFTLAGKIITLIMIQAGGLGIIFLTMIFLLALAQGLSKAASVHNVMGGLLDTQNPFKMMWQICIYTFFIEGASVLIMWARLYDTPIELLGGNNPLWWAVFHSVSAFCNAGFSLNNNNLVNFANDPVVLGVIGSEIFIGGIGFPVLVWFSHLIARLFGMKTRYDDLAATPAHAKLVLSGSVLRLAVGTFIPFIIDFNSRAVSGMGVGQKLLNFWFNTGVSPSTAGFNSFDFALISTPSLLVVIALMFIGASPGGTGGGVKVPTIAIMYGYVKDFFYPPMSPVRLLGSNISRYSVNAAFRLMILSVSVVALGILALCGFESHLGENQQVNFLKLTFEAVSAFGTVGLSMGYTDAVTSLSAILTPESKIVLCIMMFVGRVGPLTLLAAIPSRRVELTDALRAEHDKPGTEVVAVG